MQCERISAGPENSHLCLQLSLWIQGDGHRGGRGYGGHGGLGGQCGHSACHGVMVMVMVLVMVMMVVVVAMVEVVKKASPSKLSLKWKVPIKHALLGKVIKSQFPSARIRCSDLDLKQLGCLEGVCLP